MKINVTENKVSIKEEQILNENEYNIHKIQFDFSSEYTDDLVKIALFSIDNHTYKKIISNNECDIPPEVLTQRGYSILGVYAYKTEQDTLVLRYSPSPTKISVYDGSYKADAENSEPITPSEIEQYQQILQNSLQQFQNQYNTLVEETEGDIQAIEDELQRKVDEGYFDGEDGFSPIAKVIQKSNGATIEIEDKNGKTTADVLNGQDGYSPIRGIDYWTEEDKQEVEEEATQQIEGKIEEYNENAAEKLNQYNQNSVQKTNDYNTNATEKTSTYNSNATEKFNDYNSNAEQKETNYNTNASQKVESFNTNASSKLSEYNSNAETKKTAYDENATQKTNSFNTNATNKLTEYNTNHTEKMSTYNNNSTQKLNAFNENATQKTEDFDAHTEEIQDNIEILQRTDDEILSNFNKFDEVTGEDITLTGTTEIKFAKPPLPMGNSEQEGEPSPDNEVPITNVTGDVEVKVQNKNLFDKNNVIDGYRLGSDGKNFANSGYSVTDFIKVKPNTNFYRNRAITIMEAVCLYDKDKNFISRLQNGNAFTTTENTYYIKTDVENTYLNTTQLELGSTASPYTPHKEQVFPLTLGNIELCKIGDYQDYFYKESNKWYLHKEIGKVVLDGSQTINKNSSDTSNYLYYINLSDHLTGGNVISNKLTIKSLGQLNGDNSINNVGISILNSNKIIYFNIGYYLSTNTVAGVSAYLTENNITIYYVLATPTDTEITDTTLISQLEAINNALSYEEQTNISGSSDGSNPIFTVQAYKDLNKELNNKVDKVQGKELSSNDFTDTLKEKLEGLENYDDTEVKEDIADIQDEQTEQNTDIEALQTENTRLKATLPTTTGEGQEVTLDKTAELEFIKPPLPMGNSEQESTTGKNLFDEENPTGDNLSTTSVLDNIITISSTATNTTPFARWHFENLSEGDAIRIDGIILDNNGQILMQIFNGTNWITIEESRLVYIDGKTVAHYAYNVTSVVQAVRFLLYANKTIPTGASSSRYKSVIVTKNNSDMTYEPYTGGEASPNPDYPQEITNVTGDVEVKVQNKNLWKIKNYSKTGWVITIDNPLKGLLPGNYTVSCVNKYITAGKGMVMFLANTVNADLADRVGSILTNYPFGNTYFQDTHTLTQEQMNAKYLIIGPQDNLCTQEVLENMKITIEQNSTATDYTPHKEQVLPLTLGNIELCKIGDYQDYFYKENNKWYLHKEIDKKILDGSENYTLVSAEGYVKFTSNQLINNSVATGICISSHFHLGTNAIGVFKVYNNNWVDIFTEIMTLEEFKTWLSNNNVSMYYACIPTDTEITDTTLISQLEAIKQAISYEEQTNISSNTIALFNVEAYQSTKLILKEMATAIVALGGV